MALILALRCSRLILSNLAASRFPAAKACTTCIPVICSWTKALRAATAFLTRIKDLLTDSLKSQVARSRRGKGARQIRVSRQSARNMNSSTERIDNRSAIIGISPSEKISLIASMSLIVRVVNVPMGVLSNWERLRPSTFLYTFTRRSPDDRLSQPGRNKGKIKAGDGFNQEQADLQHGHPDDEGFHFFP